MLLEKKEHIAVTRGFILMGKRGKTYEIKFDEAKRLDVLRVADSIRKTLELALIPTTSATSAQCCQCEYSNFCADRLWDNKTENPFRNSPSAQIRMPEGSGRNQSWI